MKISGEKTKISIGFAQVLMFVIPFLLLINGEIGWIMLYAVVAAYIISAVLFLISVHNIKLEMTPEFLGVHEKNETVTVNVTIKKTGFCLLPHITLRLMAGGIENVLTARTALIGRSSVTVSFKCGFAECGLNKATLLCWWGEDILGFISREADSGLCSTVAVLPELKPLENITLTPKLIPDEDDEEQEETVSNALFGGMPGFEYRRYEAGDSPRKINFKLSAKQRELMVRRDESTISGTTRILIRSNSYPDSFEKALSMADELVRRGGTAEIFHCGESFRASSPATLDKLREWLAFRKVGKLPDVSEEQLFEKMDYIISRSYEETAENYEV
ncbi:MAG: DUF58 domain-containing protein [Oscillospiraceae bacterium]